MYRKSIRGLATALSALALVLTVGPMPANAAARNGVCDDGEFCYYYNSDNAGSVSDFAGSGSISDYGTSQPSCYDFKGTGAGKGQCIKNNAASVWNRSKQGARVHFNSSLAGDYQDVAPGARGNLNARLKNNNASHRHFTPAPTATYTPGCDTGRKRFYVQEGSVPLKIGAIDTTFKVCYDNRGQISSADVDSSVLTTGPGSAGGFTFESQAPQEIEQTATTYLAESVSTYKNCLVKVIPICGQAIEVRVRVGYYAPSFKSKTPERVWWAPRCVTTPCKASFSETA